MGNTPTGVGKTHRWPHLHRRAQKHPHGRGEDKRLLRPAPPPPETPPRAWGRPRLHRAMRWRDRNTPTGVGKTTARKHFSHQPPETPPRAWGRRWPALLALTTCGNTPTGVGKTCRLMLWHRPRWKHPHGRGEDTGKASGRAVKEETPPRAWGRLAYRSHQRPIPGNTPTGVGKTPIYCERAVIKTPYIRINAILGFRQ